MSNSSIVLRHHSGLTNMSDLSTKCLASALFHKHRLALDFEERGFPKESVFVVWGRVNGLMNGVEGQVDVALVEVCCEQDSALNVETLKGRILCWCCSQCSV